MVIGRFEITTTREAAKTSFLKKTGPTTSKMVKKIFQAYKFYGFGTSFLDIQKP
jgi:hypothetical protein